MATEPTDPDELLETVAVHIGWLGRAVDCDEHRTDNWQSADHLGQLVAALREARTELAFHKATAVAENPRVLPQNEAIELTRPADRNTPWRWSDPIDAIVGDSGKWDQWPEFSDADGWWPVRVAQSAIENLYRAGFALVRVPGPSNATDTQETHHAR